MHRASLVATGIIFFASCQSSVSRELREELRLESARTGLALVGISGNGPVVIPFDDEERHLGGRVQQFLGVSKSGRSVIWWESPKRLLATARLKLEQTDGRRTIEIPRPAAISSFLPRAANDEANYLAFWGQDALQRGLFWMTLDGALGGFVSSLDQADGVCDWAPDGGRLAFEKDGRLFIYTVHNQATTDLVEGHNPTWSPDGRRIAFTSSDGKASVIRPDGTLETWVLGPHRPLSQMRWSPDGKYVAFAEQVPGEMKIPFLSVYSRLIVVRVSDGGILPVRDFGSESLGVGSFSWILDYPAFLAAQKPN